MYLSEDHVRLSRFMSAPYDRSMHNTYYTTFGISMPLLEQHRKNERAGTSDGVYDRLIPRRLSNVTLERK